MPGEISNERKEFLHTFLLVLLYAAGFFCLQCFLFSAGMIPDYPRNGNLVVWDAAFYRSIATYGYITPRDPGGLSLAFFPLFPLVWRALQVDVWGIVVLNVVCLATGMGLLCCIYKISTQNKLLWLSLPAVFFAFVPYTEALYFMLAAVALYGLHKNKTAWVCISLFLLSLTRISATFLVPALVAMAVLSAGSGGLWRSLKTCFLGYVLPILAGTALFFFYEYRATGNPNAFYDVQKNWSHHFKLPVLPFNNVSGPRMTWTSNMVFFACIVAALYLIYTFCRWAFRGIRADKLLVLSCGYMLVLLLETIFYNTPDGFTTNLAGLMRYATINPFFYVFLYHFTTAAVYTWKHYVGVIALSSVVWLMFPHADAGAILALQGCTLLVVLFMLHASQKLQWPVIVLTALCLFFQVHYFEQFIRNIYTE